MQTIDINKKIVDSYLELLRNLSPDNKLDLISRLSDSLKSNKKKAKINVFKLDFIPEKNAEEIIRDLKTSKNFNREIEAF